MTLDPTTHQVSPTLRLTAWTLVGLVVAVIVASLVSKIEIIARGQGKIVPTSKVQIIQSQESGRVADILVKEGETVTTGQRLISLDKSDAQSQIVQLMAETEKQGLEKALSVFVLDELQRNDPAAIEFGKGVSVKSADDKTLASLVTSTLESIRDEIVQVDAEVKKLASSLETQRVKISTGNEELKLAQQRYDTAVALRKTGTISEYELTEREANFKKIEGGVAVATSEAKEIEAAKLAIQKQRLSIISRYKASYEERLTAAQATLQALQGQLVRQQFRVDNAELVAPVEGKVENLKLTTIGGFVDAGTPVLTIVPSAGSLEVEAYFENRDVGFLANGQQAFVKLDAFPAERFGFVKGNVISVGADARDPTSKNNWVYAVRLSLERDQVLSNNKPIKFVSGMSATIDVVTGTRPVASYFFEPIIKAVQDSFGER